jgi:MFS family permease
MRHGLSRILLPLGGLIVPITNEAVFPMLPIFQKTYGIDAQTANALVPSMILPFAAMMLVAGAITARYGRRRMLLIGFCGIALGSLLISVAPDFTYVLAGRILQGVSASFVIPGIIAAIGDEVEPSLRGRTMGIFMISITVGAALGPMIGGWLSEWGGIAPVQVFLAGVAVLFAIYYWFILAKPAASTEVPPRIGPELQKAYRSPAIIGIGVTGAAIFIALMGCMTFSARVLAGAPFELGPGAIGSLLSVGLAAGIFGALAGGNMTDSWGRSRTTIAGIVIMCFGGIVVIASAIWPTALGLVGFVIGLSALGGGHAVSMTALETLSVEVLPGHRDAATSLFNALRFAGYGIAPPLAVWLFSVFGHPAWVYAILTAGLFVGLMYFMHRVKNNLTELNLS